MHDQLTPREQIRLAHAEWSQKTFGNVGPVGPLKHLAKEALEAAAEPGHLDEWADIQFLLWDAPRRAGITDDQITAAMVAKLEVNKARKWPEPKDGEPRLHIKEDEGANSRAPGELYAPTKEELDIASTAAWEHFPHSNSQRQAFMAGAKFGANDRHELRQKLHEFNLAEAERIRAKNAALAVEVSEPNGILPCPFCGGVADRVTIEEVNDLCFGGDVIACLDCGASSHVEYGRKENLVSVWNNRAAPQPVYNDSEAQAMLKRLAVIMAGNDSGGELAALTVTAQSLVDRCKALAVERDTLAALPPPFPLPDVSARVFSRVAYRWALTADQIRQIYQAIGTHLEIETSKLEIKDFPLISDVMNAQAADPAQCVSVGYTPQLTKYQPEPGISGKKTGWVLIDEHGIKQAVAWLWTHPNGHCDLTFPQTGALGRAAARIAGGWSYTPLAPCGEPSQELESGAKS
ncbi:DUF550 domain-containing protein [Salmonella enterica subsp. enterica]|nr:DUF550 domain-containing protein [Salmonella enterica subsp. enterica]EGI6509429.1 DUF550 domain-containing protein [Salmonella enterica subsp. enterica serovar Durham]